MTFDYEDLCSRSSVRRFAASEAELTVLQHDLQATQSLLKKADKNLEDMRICMLKVSSEKDALQTQLENEMQMGLRKEEIASELQRKLDHLDMNAAEASNLRLMVEVKDAKIAELTAEVFELKELGSRMQAKEDDVMTYKTELVVKDQLIMDLSEQLLQANTAKDEVLERLRGRDKKIADLVAHSSNQKAANDINLEKLGTALNSEMENLKKAKNTEIEALRAGDDPDRYARGTAYRTSTFHHDYLCHSGHSSQDGSLPLSARDIKARKVFTYVDIKFWKGRSEWTCDRFNEDVAQERYGTVRRIFELSNHDPNYLSIVHISIEDGFRAAQYWIPLEKAPYFVASIPEEFEAYVITQTTEGLPTPKRLTEPVNQFNAQSLRGICGKRGVCFIGEQTTWKNVLSSSRGKRKFRDETVSAKKPRDGNHPNHDGEER